MIYFIATEDEKYVKIGYTRKDPKSRLKELQTGNPQSLKIIYSKYGDTDMEKFYHQKFNKYRIKGEWFEYSDEIREFIKPDRFIIAGEIKGFLEKLYKLRQINNRLGHINSSQVSEITKKFKSLEKLLLKKTNKWIKPIKDFPVVDRGIWEILFTEIGYDQKKCLYDNLKRLLDLIKEFTIDRKNSDNNTIRQDYKKIRSMELENYPNNSTR